MQTIARYLSVVYGSKLADVCGASAVIVYLKCTFMLLRNTLYPHFKMEIVQCHFLFCCD